MPLGNVKCLRLNIEILEVHTICQSSFYEDGGLLGEKERPNYVLQFWETSLKSYGSDKKSGS